MGDLMIKKKLINKEILDKIYSLDESEEIKNFLIDALIWEYDNIDETKKSKKKKFDDLISKYVEGNKS